MTHLTFELLAIGNEILQGDVLDTNSHWLCRELAERGARVLRITVLPDDERVIGEGVIAALGRRPSAVITCGGLGPTVDDLTAGAVASALGRPLAEDAVALRMVTELYRRLFALGLVPTSELTPARRKMANLPAGALPLPNSVGAAPGIWLEHEGATVACLPGVPAEMKAIFTEQLWPRLAARRSTGAAPVFAERLVRTDSQDESLMAPAVDAVTARHPLVYVKSRAQVYGGSETDFVTLSVRAVDQAEATDLLDAAETDLRAALAAVGVKTS